LTCTRATLLYSLILFWFIEFINNNEYRFWKESFKAKIRELSNKNLKEGNWIQQAQQELLDRNINPTSASASKGKPFTKRLRDNSVKEVNLTSKDTTKNNSKQNKRAKSNLNKVLVKSKESTRNKPFVSNTTKCKVCDKNYATKDCYYMSKNPPLG
jgi:hypothetical protein